MLERNKGNKGLAPQIQSQLAQVRCWTDCTPTKYVWQRVSLRVRRPQHKSIQKCLSNGRGPLCERALLHLRRARSPAPAACVLSLSAMPLWPWRTCQRVTHPPLYNKACRQRQSYLDSKRTGYGTIVWMLCVQQLTPDPSPGLVFPQRSFGSICAITTAAGPLALLLVMNLHFISVPSTSVCLENGSTPPPPHCQLSTSNHD
jgi:hypothetical protein